MAITLSRLFLKTTILENNIIQTTGSAGESIAAGVVFTLPGFLFLSDPSSADYFNYFTILILAILGGFLGTLMMIPLRAPIDRERTWQPSLSGRNSLRFRSKGR